MQIPEQFTKKLLLTEAEAAQVVGFSPRFLQQRRREGGGPVYIRVSARAVRYRLADLEAWAEERARTSTSDPGPDGGA